MRVPNQYTSSNHSTEVALSIMELLADSREPLRLKDISESLGANTSTVLRFLNTFINSGYVAQDPVSQRYSLTYKICRLAWQVQENSELQAITHPYLMELSSRFGEAACVSVKSDMCMVYIDTASGTGKSLMSRQQIGGNAPMHCTGNGKLCMLEFSETQIDEYIERKGLTKLTESTIVSRGKLLEELDKIRRQGFAEDREECEIGVRCIAYPIFDFTGKIVAGISITGPVSRMKSPALDKMKSALSEAAAAISARLGASDFNN